MRSSVERTQHPNVASSVMRATRSSAVLACWTFAAIASFCTAINPSPELNLNWIPSLAHPLLQVENLNTIQAFERATGYTYNLPEHLLHAGVQFGTDKRVHRFLLKWLSGQQVHVGLIGGSISAGAGVRKPGTTDIFSRFASFLQKAHPTGKVVAINGAMSATTSAYMEMCLPHHMHAESDFMMVDYAVNDDRWFTPSLNASSARVYEQLLRKMMSFPNKPAVLPLMFMKPFKRIGLQLTQWPYWATNEHRYLTVASHYGLTCVSARTALYQLCVQNVTGYTRFDLMGDAEVHPSDYGAKLYNDLIVYALQRSMLALAHDLATHGAEAAAGAVMQAPPELQPPCIQGNYEARTLRCHSQEAMFSLMANTTGDFRWGFETRSGEFAFAKWGFVAHTPGSTLVLDINTQDDEDDSTKARMVDGMVKRVSNSTTPPRFTGKTPGDNKTGVAAEGVGRTPSRLLLSESDVVLDPAVGGGVTGTRLQMTADAAAAAVAAAGGGVHADYLARETPQQIPPMAQLFGPADRPAVVPGLRVVRVGFLRSYKHMGMARLECIRGCTCKAEDVDGHHSIYTSQTFIVRMEVTPHKHCMMQVTVLPTTNSGEHKFKLTTIAVTEYTPAQADSGLVI